MTKINRLMTLVIILLVSGSCFAEALDISSSEQVWLDGHPILKMSIDPDYGPYTFLDKNGKVQGIAVEFFVEIEKLLGIRFEIIRDLSWTEQMQAVKERQIDIVATAVKLPE